MALTPLDPAQTRGVDTLLAARRLEQVPVDLRRAELFLDGPGQHEALGRFLKAVLTTPPGPQSVALRDSQRR